MMNDVAGSVGIQLTVGGRATGQVWPSHIGGLVAPSVDEIVRRRFREQVGDDDTAATLLAKAKGRLAEVRLKLAEIEALREEEARLEAMIAAAESTTK